MHDTRKGIHFALNPFPSIRDVASFRPSMFSTFVFRARVSVLELLRDFVISDAGYHHRVVVCNTRKTARACVAVELHFEKIIKPREQNKVSPRSSKDRNAEITNATTSGVRPRGVSLSHLANYFSLSDVWKRRDPARQRDWASKLFLLLRLCARPPPPRFGTVDFEVF